MAHNIKDIENEIHEFVTKFPVLSFKIEFSEKYSSILVCYEEVEGISDNDPVWDELIAFKIKLESIVGEGNVLFSNGDILFSVGPEAIVISADTVESGTVTFSSQLMENSNIEYMGPILPHYVRTNVDYCLAA